MMTTEPKIYPETGPGSLSDARANSREMHRIADQMVDKNGAFHPKSVLARGAAVAYDLSIVGPAQEAGEAWGNPARWVSLFA